MSGIESVHWYALAVWPRYELRVHSCLEAKDQQVFTPTKLIERNWSDRIKKIVSPLIPGYVFCRIERASFGLVLSTLGVSRIVSFGGRPYPVREDEIQSMRQATKSERRTKSVPFMEVGELVEVCSGPLRGIRGKIQRIKSGNRLIISIDLIMRSIAIELSASDLVTTNLGALDDFNRTINASIRAPAG